MPEFDLAKAYNAEYRVAGLSNIGRPCGVHLALHDPQGQWWDTGHLGGSLRIDVLNAQGKKLVSVNGRLGNFIWAGVGDLHYLYDLEKSFFTPDSREEYLVRIAYEPDQRLAGFKGFVYVVSGDHK